MSKNKRNRYRSYTTENGKNKLSAWIQRRCEDCGRFIGGVKQFLCKECYKKRYIISVKEKDMRRNEVWYYSRQSIRELAGVPLPSNLWYSLRSYM